jgi:hypothetical protein
VGVTTIFSVKGRWPKPASTTCNSSTPQQRHHSSTSLSCAAISIVVAMASRLLSSLKCKKHHVMRHSAPGEAGDPHRTQSQRGGWRHPG